MQITCDIHQISSFNLHEYQSARIWEINNMLWNYFKGEYIQEKIIQEFYNYSVAKE